MVFVKKGDSDIFGKKRAQVTIFIVVAILIVAGVATYLIFRSNLSTDTSLPKNIAPVYNSLLDCISQDMQTGVNILESQGGRIYLPEYEPPSAYFPFSNTLQVIGLSVPYWSYVSANGVEKSNVPTKVAMQKDLAKFVQEKIRQCNLNSYYPKGYSVYMGEPKVSMVIRDNEVETSIDMPLTISFENERSVINTHSVVIPSELGGLYTSAVNIYNKEQTDLFLENYAIDVLRFYAPVDGVELGCSPKVWVAEDVVNELKQALEINTYALRNLGGDYVLKNEVNKYFVLDLGTNYDVRFLTSANWSNSYDIYPSTGNLLIANVVGNQPGLGIIGFCYAPYHFVYNVKYPVLVQLTKGSEIFQFPMGVVIEGNKPRKALPVESFTKGNEEFCTYQNTPMTINVYDNSLNPVEADLSYDCSGTSCEMGSVDKISGLKTNFPQCFNGVLTAKAEGFVEAKKTISTVDAGQEEIILNKLYSLDLSVLLGGIRSEANSIIYFSSPDYSTTVLYPDNKKVELAEGQYKISVYSYQNSSLTIPASSKTQCVDSPKSGLGGLFGATEKKCFDINMPEQLISNALAGGGEENYYIAESELSGASTLKISASKLPVPTTLEELQDNYNLFGQQGLGVEFTQ